MAPDMSDFHEISKNIFLLEPVEPVFGYVPQSSLSDPELVVIFSWADAHPRHLKKCK